jgi:hypothetical protein
MLVAMVQEPIKIPISDPQALMLHSQIMVSRAARYEVLEREVDVSRQKMVDAEMAYKLAKLELEMVQLQSERLLNQEKGLVNAFFAQVRASNSQMKTLQERYGDGVKFIFDSDHKDVWIVSIFSSDAPPILQDEDDFMGEHYDSSEDNDDGEENLPDVG